MKIRQIMLVMGVAAVVSGCTKSNIVQPEGALEPDFNMYQNIVIDEEQLQMDVRDIYVDSGDYPVASEIEVDLDLENQQVNITVIVMDGTKPEEAAEYAMVAIKGVNDEVAIQDFSYGVSGEDSYGGLYQDNMINLKVYEADGVPLYEGQIPADTYEVIVIE